MSTSYQYIETATQLENAVTDCAESAVLTVDTEFTRTSTYYPIVGLIQVFNGRDCYIIDPLAVPDLSALAGLLANPAILKVFHACSEDFEVFLHGIGVVPGPVFDTQIGAAVMGINFSISYQGLVEHFLGLNIPKEQTRSDWLQRPLTQAQLDYAALDVIYLYQIFEMQRQTLITTGRMAWVEEECSHLADDISITIDPQRYYQRVKSGARMSRAELNVLRSLCAWREAKARELDIPRNRVIEEKSLITMTRMRGEGLSALTDEGALTHRQARRFGDEILKALAEAREKPADLHPEPLDDATRLQDKNDRLKRLKLVVESRAQELGVSPEMLARRKHLEQLLRTEGPPGRFELPAPLQGWRREAIGNHLLAALAEVS